jgi:hypothetical protein
MSCVASSNTFAPRIFSKLNTAHVPLCGPRLPPAVAVNSIPRGAFGHVAAISADEPLPLAGDVQDRKIAVKARGQSLGRPFKLTPHQRSEAIRRRDRGETLSDIARSYNVHPSTISRLTA